MSRHARRRAQLLAARSRVQDMEGEIARLRRSWHYFRRLKLRRQLQPLGMQVLLAEQEAATRAPARDCRGS